MPGSSEHNVVKAAEADPVTVQLPVNNCTRHVLSAFGCIQIIELFSLVTAFICSLLNDVWLFKGGGSYVCFTIVTAFVFTLISLSFRVAGFCDTRSRWQLAEWISYLIILLLLIVAVAVNIRACYLEYTDTDIYGRAMMIHTDHVIGTAVFVVVCTLGFFIHFVWLTTSRYKAAANIK